MITAERLAPGFARNLNPLRLTIGEIDNTRTQRTEQLAQMLIDCGIATKVSTRIRDALWTKVIANLTSNPLSVIAGASIRDCYSDPSLSRITRQLWDEVLFTAAAYGARVELDPESFLAMGASMGQTKTSMLQDFEKGLPLELSSICEAVIELAELHHLPMPLTKSITGSEQVACDGNPSIN